MTMKEGLINLKILKYKKKSQFEITKTKKTKTTKLITIITLYGG